ncbi:2'-5' RNA ligase [Corynebacterium striatum]|nr:2'-5' RNA ligase [Corynebacterium striatum]
MSVKSPENLLLYLLEEQERAIAELFDDLVRRGLPRQNQRPHITITFAQSMAPEAVELAAELLPPLLPATFQRVGTVVFGTRSKQSIAWLLETTDEFEAAAREISAANPESRGARWTPHLTMGLRIPRGEVGRYIDVLDAATNEATRAAARSGGHLLKESTAAQAAYWRSATEELRVLWGDRVA